MIKINDVNLNFGTRGIAGLHSLTFEVKEGEIFAIMGPNGSGKTTLLKVLTGQLIPQRGKVLSPSTISMFPNEESIPTHHNVQNFLTSSITLDISDEKKIQLSRDLAETFEFTFQLKQRINELSSGQKQKVLLSKQLINRPGLLLMDEPFTHLDPLTRKDILKGLFTYIKQQNMTVIWVTHDLDESFMFADRVAILNFGRLEQLTTPLEMIIKPRNLFVAQFIGYKNFITLKFTPDGWISPWGKLMFLPIEKDDAIMLIPDHAWIISANEGINVTIKQRRAVKQHIEYVMEYLNQTLYLSRGVRHHLLNENATISIYPILEECFLIPL
jgi:ABC-type Fe3+/spermidine/putrescine transport system ATPase subunit